MMNMFLMTRKSGETEIFPEEPESLKGDGPGIHEHYRIAARILRGLDPEGEEASDLDPYDVESMLEGQGDRVVKIEWYELNFAKNTMICTEIVEAK